ncbi:carboxymuconolactone decarboxylase family protein [Glycomyces buryatensis]|uniref:Carboxymuconolactone decarboxylase family protein n=1 Tax=Glycomyces buryatensis TaxID=2570927 RepID=A0A4S8QCY8_9ACTN|nr:carboxymuconolactone decarboxylase family protein [Glycomyces buryatensis]THV41461.1 carboxymuconolactone decarboxylase family protein [Glycomyces buryatensis]
MEKRLEFAATDFGQQYYKNMLANEALFHDGPLSSATAELVKIRASQINGCGYCLDMHTKDAASYGETAERLAMVAVWREAPHFTESERAALALTEEACRLADNPHGVSDETWETARKHFEDEELAALLAMIAQINAWNRLNVTIRNPAGTYDPKTKAARYAGR